MGLGDIWGPGVTQVTLGVDMWVREAEGTPRGGGDTSDPRGDTRDPGGDSSDPEGEVTPMTPGVTQGTLGGDTWVRVTAVTLGGGGDTDDPRGDSSDPGGVTCGSG